METSIQEAFKVLRANVISEVLQLLDKFQDKSELVSNEIRTLSAELDSVWTCHVASKSPLPLSPSCGQVIVSQNQEVTQSGPKPINTSIDDETSQRDVSDDAALQREPLNREPHDREISPEAIPLPPPSNEASCRSPSSPDPLNTQHLLQDNASHDTGNNSPESVVEHRRDKRRVEETEIREREEEEEEEEGEDCEQ